ncbi:hypothetical protein NDU88_010175 [Pleurodeles waltl]|uniref:Uncharacterized protein n=1 Tax=Pleurodeles waltl TaxID=8319 RepID=A0AAV7RZX2_PLEWA|nr:hypothetical protein NDU88_010175 [Pleurodeles waltl]
MQGRPASRSVTEAPGQGRGAGSVCPRREGGGVCVSTLRGSTDSWDYDRIELAREPTGAPARPAHCRGARAARTDSELARHLHPALQHFLLCTRYS